MIFESLLVWLAFIQALTAWYSADIEVASRIMSGMSPLPPPPRNMLEPPGRVFFVAGGEKNVFDVRPGGFSNAKQENNSTSPSYNTKQENITHFSDVNGTSFCGQNETNFDNYTDAGPGEGHHDFSANVRVNNLLFTLANTTGSSLVSALKIVASESLRFSDCLDGTGNNIKIATCLIESSTTIRHRHHLQAIIWKTEVINTLTAFGDNLRHTITDMVQVAVLLSTVVVQVAVLVSTVILQTLSIVTVLSFIVTELCLFLLLLEFAYQFGKQFLSTMRANSPKPPTRVGLPNLGQTCYLNSVVQVLFHSPICNMVIDSDCGGIVTTLLRNVFLAMRGGDESFIRLTLFDLKKYFEETYFFSIDRQQCVGEFMTLLVSALRGEAEWSTGELSMFLKHAMFHKEKSTLVCASCGGSGGTETGEMGFTLHLTCSKDMSLVSLLKDYLSEEKLDPSNAWRCSRCGVKTCAAKKISLSSPPPVLPVLLKRTSSTLNKNKSKVTFAKTLDFSGFYEGEESLFYNLIGVVNHHGGWAASGHYTADAVGSDGKWFTFNDTSCGPTWGYPNYSTASLLLFERKN